MLLQITIKSFEVQEQNAISCFIRHEDGRVTCPNRCTDGKTFKTMKFGDETHYVPVIMYGSGKYLLQELPAIDQPMRYNAFGKGNRRLVPACLKTEEQR